MADRENELRTEKETAALKKLQAFAGVAEKGTTERLDWMYEQSTAQKNDLEAMNTAVSGQKDQDVADVKALSGHVSGSIFLKGPATRTTEDMLRKLREDPLFQIRREEQAAKDSMMSNPLILARLKKKQEKASKKDKKALKKLAKKEKKAMKKAKKAAKKAGGKKSSSSSSSSADSGTGPSSTKIPAMPTVAFRGRERSRSPARGRKEELKEEKKEECLGPDSAMIGRREEYAQRLAKRKEESVASRGLSHKMDDAEKKRRVEQMQADARAHDRHKDKRMEENARKAKEQEELEAKMRANSDQKYFKDMREQAYMDDNKSMSDRLKNQRHRRQKGIVDSLEKDDR